MMRRTVLLLALLLGAGAADAQLPFLRKRDAQPQQPVLQGIDALRADFAAQSGGTTVYFGGESAILGAAAKAALESLGNDGAARVKREQEGPGIKGGVFMLTGLGRDAFADH